MRALAAFKTDEQLAKLLDKPVDLIKLQFSIMACLPKRPEEKPAAIAKLLSTGDTDSLPVTELEIVKKEKKPLSVHAQALDRLKSRKGKNQKGIYKTRPIDLKGQVRVKLNDRTTVYAKPGYDIEELKKKYKIA